MGAAGIFSEDDRVELIEGEILKMSPIGSLHVAVVNRTHREFDRQLGDRAIVSGQNPILLNDFSEPQPDIAVLQPRDDFYASELSKVADVLLVVEVADTTVTYDRETKFPAYARAGIAEAWLADLPAECIEKHTDPVDGVYRKIEKFRRSDTIASSSVPGLVVAVEKILG